MSGPPEGLLIDVQRRLESLYGLDAEAPVTDFVIPHEKASSYPGGGSRTLVQESGGSIALGLVLERSVCEDLRRHDPRARLDSDNLSSFCAMTEEVSHFLYLLFRARLERPVTQLEIELQGEVDKYLTTVFFLSLQNEGAVSPRLRELLFRQYHLKGGLTRESEERYHAASGLAERYCTWLEKTFLRERRVFDLTREARRFYRLGLREKLEIIAEIR